MHTDTNDDEVFWERLADMPDIEAEMEMVSRKSLVISENNQLIEYVDGGVTKDALEAGKKIRDNNLQLSMLNDKLKIIRKRMDRVEWRKAVKEVLGQEAFEKCAIWIEQNSIR